MNNFFRHFFFFIVLVFYPFDKIVVSLCAEQSLSNDFKLAQTFRYAKQQARLDYAFTEGVLVKNRQEYLLGDADILYWNSFLTYKKSITLFYNQTFFVPRITSYNIDNARFQLEATHFQYHGEIGGFYHFKSLSDFFPFRLGSSYVFNGADNLLSFNNKPLEQRLHLAHNHSVNIYAGLDVPIFSLPIHLISDFRLNAPIIFQTDKLIYDITNGFLVYVTYYFNFSLRHRLVLLANPNTERHLLQFLFNYRVLDWIGFNVEYVTFLYAEGEASQSVVSVGLYLLFDW